jgi:hypothetical protein
MLTDPGEALMEYAPRLQEGGLKLQVNLNEVSFRKIWFRPE